MSEDGRDLALVNSKIDAIHSFGFRTSALVIRFVEIGYSDRLTAFHLSHHRLYVAIRLLARDERIRLAVRRWHLQIDVWKRWSYSIHSPISSIIERKEKK